MIVRGGAAPDYTHLFRLSDDTGLLEHARGAVPLREHGYCVDDAARGLVVACREPFPSSALVGLAERYLGFLAHGQSGDGRFRNRMGYDRRWQDEPDTADAWGRALWGLGTAASRGHSPWMRTAALELFESGVTLRSPWIRSNAFAALGAVEVLAAIPGHESARGLLEDAAKAIRVPDPYGPWPWPESRLAYANAALPEVLIGAGVLLPDEALLEEGLAMLGWLLDAETSTESAHLSPTPAGGWGMGDPRPGFDQQPIEAAALADACTAALKATGDARWAEGLRLAVAWFCGDNDLGLALHDPWTGGGHDGLGPGGRNANQGAESTLALISAYQRRRLLAADHS